MKNIQLIATITAVILLTPVHWHCVLGAEPPAAGDNLATKVFTEEMAQRILSAPVQPAERNKEADLKNGAVTVSRCSYSAKGDAVLPITLSLMLRRAGSPAEAKSIFLSSKSTYKGEAVAGLGDDAYHTAAPAQLNVLKGANWLIISAGAFPKEDRALQEKTANEILKAIKD
jgi:hypothetical protein